MVRDEVLAPKRVSNSRSYSNPLHIGHIFPTIHAQRTLAKVMQTSSLTSGVMGRLTKGCNASVNSDANSSRSVSVHSMLRSY